MIVFEGNEYVSATAFDGSLDNLDVAGTVYECPHKDVTISSDDTTIGNYITGDYTANAFTITKITGSDNYTIQSAKGHYIGKTANSNGLDSGPNEAYTNTISINPDGSANIIGSGGAYLRFNSDKNQVRFRYFKSSTYGGQQAICLYRLEDGTGGGDALDPSTMSISWVGSSLVLDAQLEIRYYIDISNVEGASEWGYRLYADGETPTDTPVTAFATDSDGDDYYFSNGWIAAKDINKVYNVQIYAKVNGEYVESDVITYSVAQHKANVEYQKDKGETTYNGFAIDQLLTTITALEAYGSAAETLFASTATE